MYPPLYPIALIFSKLLPYDFKNNYLKLKEEDLESNVLTCLKFSNLK